MGLYASFDVIGDFGFIDATEEWGIEPDYSAGCSTFVSTFMASAQGSVPVDTGYLQSTINASTDGHSFCEAEASAEYAQYVEYGTWKMGAQAYFTPALEAAIAAAAPLWTQAEEEAIREDEQLTEEAEEAERQAEREAAQQAQNQTNAGVGGVGGGSFGQMAAQALATAVMALVITFFQAATGHDFRESNGSGRRSTQGGGAAFVPDVIIT